MGILGDLILANASLPRFIFWNGELKTLPTSVRDLWQTDLLSGRGKARLLLGLLGVVGPKRARGDESIEQFCTRHFGKPESC
jgi:oxygen-dependent protoporphyrinogen oxidase